ncbi:MAG: hypothetical protein R2864_02325 [Syntrophotaleaceae bacterium]
MMLRHSFAAEEAAGAIENAVEQALNEGFERRTSIRDWPVSNWCRPAAWVPQSGLICRRRFSLIRG